MKNRELRRLGHRYRLLVAIPAARHRLERLSRDARDLLDMHLAGWDVDDIIDNLAWRNHLGGSGRLSEQDTSFGEVRFMNLLTEISQVLAPR